jgi:hypothetical protein
MTQEVQTNPDKHEQTSTEKKVGRPRKQFSEEEIDRLTALWKEWGKVDILASIYNVSWDTMRRWLDSLGIRDDPTNRNKKLADRGKTEE